MHDLINQVFQGVEGLPFASDQQAAAVAESLLASAQQAQTGVAELEGVGITEHLGARLPLDAAFVDEDGKAGKPFVLPQRDPRFYDSFLRVYNLPELAATPVAVRPPAIDRALRLPAGKAAGAPPPHPSGES